ncbi:MAG: hypothetical protein AAGF12_07350 [Myxococcota bacterium]
MIEVSVPRWLKNQPQLVLQIGLDMPIPIPDLRLDDDGLHGTLSFRQSPFTCEVGWDAVFALVGEDGRGMIWPEALPTEIAREVERESMRHGLDGARALDQQPPSSSGTAQRKPSVVDADGVGLSATQDDAAGRPKELRLVKEPTGDRAVPRDAAPEPSSGRRELPPYLRVIK